MVHPYSQDLRERALNLIQNGMSISHVSRLLNISRPTLHQWRDRYLTTGSIVAKANVPPPQTSKIKDWEEFEKFVEANHEQTQKQMAATWGNCSRFTISRGLKKLGFTRKKSECLIPRFPRNVRGTQDKHMVIKKETNSKEKNLSLN